MGLVTTVFLALMVGLAAWSILKPMANYAETEKSLDLLLDMLPALGLFSSFWMMLVSALGLGIQTFYQSSEMSLLLSSPVRTSSVFASKFVETVLHNSGLFLLIAVPVSVAYGIARETFGPAYILTAAVSLLAFAVLPTCLGLLTSMVVMRILPTGRYRETITGIGVALIAGAYFYASVRLSSAGGDDLETLRNRVMPLSSLAHLPVVQSGPWGWTGSTFFVRGGQEVVGGLLRLLLAAIAAIGTSALLADRLFRQGWLNQQDGAGTRDQGGNDSRMRLLEFGIARSPIGAMLLKDLRTLVRDSRQLTALLVPIAVVGVLIFNTEGSMMRSRSEPLLVAQALLLVLSPVCLRIATGAYIAESNAFWLMLVAPNRRISILVAKLLYALGLALPLGLIAAGAFGRAAEMDPSRQLFLVATAAVAVVGFCSIGIFGCAAAADFREGAPRFGNTVLVRMGLFVAQIVYLGLVALTFGAAFIVVKQGISTFEVANGIALAVIVVMTSALGVAGLYFAANRLQNAEWGI
ncbi:MAG: hypothetical protein ABJA67_01960 [Chthonomonadales bacterium]